MSGELEELLPDKPQTSSMLEEIITIDKSASIEKEECSNTDEVLQENVKAELVDDNFDQEMVAKITSESKIDDATQKQTRELKSILALAKEAKLDTNIIHKRKSMEPIGKPEKLETIGKRRKSCCYSSEYLKEEDELKGQGSCTTSKSFSDSEKTFTDASDSEDTKQTKEVNNRFNLKRKCTTADNTNESAEKRSKRGSNVIITVNNKKKDPFCWRCHHSNVRIYCETCPRSYHPKCLRQNISQPNHWLCPECVAILKAENIKERSPAMRDMSLEHLCSLLKFAVKRMFDVVGCEPFIHPVSTIEFPDYRSYIVQPMDLTCLEKNIKNNIYGSTQAFEADAKWILHNSIIFNSYQSKLTTTAKGILKICKQEMSEIENCPNCYLNANTKKDTWFVEVCPKPHLLVWAKLKGFPYWPAKAMRTNSQGYVDVRFFGAHDRAWVSSKECFLYSVQDPNSSKVKRNDIIESIKELNVYIENLKKVYGKFCYAPNREAYDPEQETNHLQLMLPRYDPNIRVTYDRSPNKENKDCSIGPSERVTNTDYSNDSDSDKSKEYEIPSEKSRNSNKVEEVVYLNHRISKEDLEELNLSKEGAEIADSQIEATSPTIRVGKVRMRGGHTNNSGKIRVIQKTATPEKENDEISKDELLIDNSENSILSDSICASNISDKINKVNISGNVEVSLSKVTSGSITAFEKVSTIMNDLPEISIESRRKPIVQVNISANENKEFTISPQNKSRIADKLMKKLSEPFEDEIESAKKTLYDNKQANLDVNETDLFLDSIRDKSLTELEKVTELSPDTEIFETNIKIQKLHSSKVDEEEKKEKSSISSDTKSTETNEKEDSKTENVAVSKENNNITSTNDFRETFSPSKGLEKLVSSVTSDKIDDHKFTDNNTKPVTQNKIDEQVNKNDDTLLQKTNNKDVNNSANVQKEVPISELPLEQVKIKPISEGLQKAVEVFQQKVKSNSTGLITQDSLNQKNKITAGYSLQKMVKVVNIETIKNKNLEKEKHIEPKITSILEKQLNIEKARNDKDKSIVTTTGCPISTGTNSFIDSNDPDIVIVKNEPLSDDEPSDSEYLDLKRKYLSALNLNESDKTLEKPKTNEIRTRSKTEDKRFKVTDNLSKVIDDVASHYSTIHANEHLNNLFKRKEIFIKPLSKMQMPKQRARKSFPGPVLPIKTYQPASRRDSAKLVKSAPFSSTSTSTVQKSALSNTITPKSLESLSKTGNVMLFTSSAQIGNSLAILPPNQTIGYGSPVLTMVQQPSGTTLANVYVPPLQSNSITSGAGSIINPTDTMNADMESQNYIPQSGAASRVLNTATTTNGVLNNIPPLASLSSQTATTNSFATTTNADNSGRSTDLSEDIQALNAFIPEALTRTISDIMYREPPVLKPRPPGPLSNDFEEAIPSSAGTVTTKVNSIAYKMTDYFRGLLIELLSDMGKNQAPEAEVVRLKLEIEELKHKHAEEILEIKKNISSVLKDIQKSVVDERNRAIDEVRSMCESECLKRVEDAKSKQWCANCCKEAQFYCCWNTSYCDYPCQQQHWTKHMSKCTQNIQNLQLQPPSCTASKSTTQQLILRPTTAAKGFTKTIISKPTKLITNLKSSKTPFNVVRTSGNHITLVEATPGNYELVGNGGPISIGGKFISTVAKIKPSNVITITSPSSSETAVISSGTVETSTHKGSISSSKQLNVRSVVISDDEGD